MRGMYLCPQDEEDKSVEAYEIMVKRSAKKNYFSKC